MPTKVATLETMSDAELDARLVRLYRQHHAASAERRGDWHAIIMDVLGIQSARLDEWLAEH